MYKSTSPFNVMIVINYPLLFVHPKHYNFFKPCSASSILEIYAWNIIFVNLKSMFIQKVKAVYVIMIYE